MNNLLVAQSGGPTAAINATLSGILEAAKANSGIHKIYGAFYGIQGVLEEEFIDLNTVIKNTIDMERLSQTPASALGSCRFHLKSWKDEPELYENFVEIARKYKIGYFIYIGGNDSMDTVCQLSAYCKENGISDIKIMGAPKTIDNDLPETDHCPGFGSAAKYIATTFAELERDISVYQVPGVTVVEVMGRDAGWLTAASALARLNGGTGPGLIYLCENAFDMEQFILDVKEKLKEKAAFLIAVSEGVRDCNGRYVSEMVQTDAVDAFGHKYISGTGRVLEDVIRKKTGCKVRSIELNLMQRCAGHIASETDLSESKMLGMKALQCAVEGKTGEMAALRRVSSHPYTVDYFSVPVEKVANQEKKIPKEYIHENGHDVTEQMMEYLEPLIQGEVNTRYQNGIPVHFIIKSRTLTEKNNK